MPAKAIIYQIKPDNLKQLKSSACNNPNAELFYFCCLKTNN